MEERRSETERSSGSEDPPAGVSNQNAEQAEREHGGDVPPEQRGATPRERDSRNRPGAAGEGSQSTGHPENAG